MDDKTRERKTWTKQEKEALCKAIMASRIPRRQECVFTIHDHPQECVTIALHTGQRNAVLLIDVEENKLNKV